MRKVNKRKRIKRKSQVKRGKSNWHTKARLDKEAFNEKINKVTSDRVLRELQDATKTAKPIQLGPFTINPTKKGGDT